MQIELRFVSKQYLLKTALSDITVSFSSAKIHALLGENGAGKSTLAGVIAGDIQPSSGTLVLDGTPANFRNTRDAISKGIVLVHQRPLLASSISAKENILLGLGNVQSEATVETLRKKWAPQLKLTSPVKDLGGDNRFYTALLCALLRSPRCLILDEPSALLDFEQRKKLYASLKELAAKGTTIIVITHSTAEAVTYADEITVLHEGKLAAQYASGAEYEHALADKSTGAGDSFESANAPLSMHSKEQQTVASIFPNQTECSGKDCCILVEHAASRPKNKPALLDATISAAYGEITMISGMQESALGTLEDIVTGMSDSKSYGTIKFFFTSGRQLRKQTISLSSGKLTAHFLRQHNTAIVPSDRTFRASNPNLTVEQMLTVYCKRNNTKETARALIKQAAIHIAPEELAANLSGGMLQRLILAREQSLNPDFFILCEPMQGLDIDAQSSLCKTLVSLARKGKAVLVLGAADFPLSLCNKVYSLEGGVTSLSFGKEMLKGNSTSIATQRTVPEALP